MGVIMKALIQAIAVGALVAMPLAAFAQSDQQPVTRAQVRAELQQLEQAGYNPSSADQSNYPADIQAAEQRVQAELQGQTQGAQNQAADTSGYGPATGSGSSSGSPAPEQPQHSIYSGH